MYSQWILNSEMRVLLVPDSKESKKKSNFGQHVTLSMRKSGLVMIQKMKIVFEFWHYGTFFIRKFILMTITLQIQIITMTHGNL
jgi:hypothetical protein